MEEKGADHRDQRIRPADSIDPIYYDKAYFLPARQGRR
jgi:non-homologous end joining protein Ku